GGRQPFHRDVQRQGALYRDRRHVRERRPGRAVDQGGQHHAVRPHRDQAAAMTEAAEARDAPGVGRRSALSSDILLLFAARAVRGFGDGFAIITLPAYLTAIGYDTAEVGYVAAASLLGTALLTLAIGFIAPRHDLRNLLIAGAALMAATGLAFPLFEHI